MSDDREDRDLRARFEALSREVEAHMPGYALARSAGIPAARRRRWPTLALAAAAALAVLGGTLVLSHRSSRRDRDALAALRLDLAAVTWVAPTDFLLETPGAVYLRTVPTFRADATPPRLLRPRPASRPAPGRNPS